jgi:UTP--glucose-1-phosphate uridylyltransferase
VEEAVAAGLHDVLFITGRSKRALEDHFDDSPELEAELAKQNKSELLGKVKDPSELAKIHFVRQGVPKGLGHAVSMAKEHVGNNPFAVLLGDDLIDPRDFVLDDMLKVQAEHGGSVVLLMEVDPSEIHLYGSAQVEKTNKENVVKVTDLVEKPNQKDAPSNYAVIGRYLFDPAVFGVLETTKPGKNGEIQLTDAMKTLAKDVKKESGGGLHAVIFKGRRYDTGDKLSYLQSVVQLASEREDLGPAFKKWLKTFVNTLGN